MIGAGIGLIGVISLVVLFPAAEQISPASPIVVVVFARLNAVWAALRCVHPWPTRQQSRMFVINSDIGIARGGAHWLELDRGVVCTELLRLGLSASDVLRWIQIPDTAHYSDHPDNDDLNRALPPHEVTSIAAYWPGRILGAVIPVTTTPLGIQFVVQTLRIDANESATDSLTGVLDRRGLHLHFADMIRLGDMFRDAVMQSAIKS